MSAEPRYVFDTNATVSAALFEQSFAGQALSAALDRGDLLLSNPTFAELSDVLRREKFDRYAAREKRERFLVTHLKEATLIETGEKIQACRDPKDDMFLEVAVAGGANCVITSDKDLLVLSPFRGIPIITPVEFLTQIAETEKKQSTPPT